MPHLISIHQIVGQTPLNNQYITRGQQKQGAYSGATRDMHELKTLQREYQVKL